MERVLEERSRKLILPPVNDAAAEAQLAATGEASANIQAPLPGPTQSELRRQRRLARYEEVVTLFQSGHSQAAISKALGLQRKTIRRWLRGGGFPERKPPHRPPPKVNEFGAYLEQRWNEGCHNATALYQEIRDKGYRGKRSMVARFVASWRKTGRTTRPNAPERISPRHAAILVTRGVDQMTEEQQRLFDRIASQCPEVVDLRQIALAFRAALTGGDAAKLRLWIEGARHCEYGPVVRFAYGLRKDLPAVSAAVETSWSTGQVEGQINRLKMIKRQMYGRAGFELLRARVLPYSSASTVGASP